MRRWARRVTRLRNRYLLLLDSLLMAICASAALVIRMEGIDDSLPYLAAITLYIAAVVPAKLFALIRCKFYSEFWAHASIPEVTTMLRSVLCASVVELTLCLAVLIPLGLLGSGFPRSVPFISATLCVLMIGGSRLGIRWLDSWVTRPEAGRMTKGVFIAGAGVAGMMTVKELLNNPQMGILPLGFLDDDPAKLGKRIHGVQVRGTLLDLPEIVRKWNAAEVIIAMPTAPGRVVRNVVNMCRNVGVQSRTIPGLFEILRGTARVDQFRSVTVEDLLRRGAITTDTTMVGEMICGRTVLLTGAGGSIGSEACRQVSDFRPAKLLLLGHGENSIYGIARELERSAGRSFQVIPLIADIRDRERMEELFSTHRPDVVFHAAAHKHVPLMETNIPDAVTNNILGTRNLVELADKYEVSRFVMVSSDKAVNPTSVMGVTKRIAELLVQEAALRTGRAFVTVRFGNVLGSRGSVVPVFQEQISSGGPVTVTHADMTRFFMTIPEAVQLVLQAGTMGLGGEVFVLDMGDPVRVADLARDLIRLSGYQEGKDVEIVYTGLRPGEKLYEELFYPNSPIEKTAHEKIMVVRHVKHDRSNGRKDHDLLYDNRLWSETDTLIEAARLGNEPMIQSLFRKIVPQYVPAQEPQIFQPHAESTLQTAGITQTARPGDS